MKNKKLGLLVALLLLVGGGVYTYARYVSTYTGTGTVDVAKWAVALKQGEETVTEDFTLGLTLSENENVAEGKIAPGRSATAQLILDLTNTEVATDYEISFPETTNLPAGMTISAVEATVGTGSKTSLTATDGKYTGELTLDEVTNSKTVTFDITVTWENNEDKNSEQTEIGIADEDLSIEVNVTAKQHIG